VRKDFFIFSRKRGERNERLSPKNSLTNPLGKKKKVITSSNLEEKRARRILLLFIGGKKTKEQETREVRERGGHMGLLSSSKGGKSISAGGKKSLELKPH